MSAPRADLEQLHDELARIETFGTEFGKMLVDRTNPERTLWAAELVRDKPAGSYWFFIAQGRDGTLSLEDVRAAPPVGEAWRDFAHE